MRSVGNRTQGGRQVAYLRTVWFKLSQAEQENLACWPFDGLRVFSDEYLNVWLGVLASAYKPKFCLGQDPLCCGTPERPV